jgi:RNA polymerase sigma-70 factor (ECF subfamily)
VDDIASVTECTPAAAKSALQRGRAALRQLAQVPEDARLPLMSDETRKKIAAYVHLFQVGDFDAIRTMLADDVKLELVNRLKLEGREKIGAYFTRYAEVAKWRFALGAVEGKPAMLVFDSTGSMERPAHFVLIDWESNRICAIRDFLFAPYALEAVDWARLS